MVLHFVLLESLIYAGFVARVLTLPTFGGRNIKITVSSRPACSTWKDPGQPELHRQTVSEGPKVNKQTKNPFVETWQHLGKGSNAAASRAAKFRIQT